jgi:hypothetical protein
VGHRPTAQAAGGLQVVGGVTVGAAGGSEARVGVSGVVGVGAVPQTHSLGGGSSPLGSGNRLFAPAMFQHASSNAAGVSGVGGGGRWEASRSARDAAPTGIQIPKDSVLTGSSAVLSSKLDVLRLRAGAGGRGIVGGHA